MRLRPHDAPGHDRGSRQPERAGCTIRPPEPGGSLPRHRARYRNPECGAVMHKLADINSAVMAGLDPAIYESAMARKDSYRRGRASPWMPRSSRGTTTLVKLRMAEGVG